MRTLRTRTVGILGALVVMIWAGAASASTISMVWISTSGSGSGVGTPTLTNVDVADTAVLEIRVTVQSTSDAGINGIGATFLYDPSVVVNLGQTPCPATANNPFSPSCGGFLTAIGGGAGLLSTILNVPNQSTGLPAGMLGADVGVAGGVGGGQSNGAFFELAHVTFSAVNGGTTGALAFSAFDGQVDINGTFTPTVPGSGATIQVNVIPEPGTIALLALGLGALAFAGRRR